MRLSIRTLAVAALIGLGGTTPASAQVSESLANRVGRWTGYGWSEGYHAYDACPSCGPWGPGFHHHPHGGSPPIHRYGATTVGSPNRHVATAPVMPARNPQPLRPFPTVSGQRSPNVSAAAPSSNRQRPQIVRPTSPGDTSSPEPVRPSQKAGALPPPQPLPSRASQTAALQEESPAASSSTLPGRYPLAR